MQVVKIFPEVGEMVDNLQTNRRMWEGALAEEISGDATKSPADKAAELVGWAWVELKLGVGWAGVGWARCGCVGWERL